jgi:hypothetical protein
MSQTGMEDIRSGKTRNCSVPELLCVANTAFERNATNEQQRFSQWRSADCPENGQTFVKTRAQNSLPMWVGMAYEKSG